MTYRRVVGARRSSCLAALARVDGGGNFKFWKCGQPEGGLRVHVDPHDSLRSRVLTVGVRQAHWRRATELLFLKKFIVAACSLEHSQSITYAPD